MLRTLRRAVARKNMLKQGYEKMNKKRSGDKSIFAFNWRKFVPRKKKARTGQGEYTA